jgi:hypothetical protein
VQDAVPDAAELAVGQQHADLGVAVGQLVGHGLDGGAGEAPVGAFDELERHPVQPEAPPVVRQLAGGLVVDDEVHGPQLVGGERAGVLDGPGRGQVEAVDEHQDHVAAQDRGGGGRGHVGLEVVRLADVLAVEPQEDHDEQRQDDEDRPRPVGELGDGDDHRDDG